jgi:hypothetical protein
VPVTGSRISAEYRYSTNGELPRSETVRGDSAARCLDLPLATREYDPGVVGVTQFQSRCCDSVLTLVLADLADSLLGATFEERHTCQSHPYWHNCEGLWHFTDMGFGNVKFQDPVFGIWLARNHSLWNHYVGTATFSMLAMPMLLPMQEISSKISK